MEREPASPRIGIPSAEKGLVGRVVFPVLSACLAAAALEPFARNPPRTGPAILPGPTTDSVQAPATPLPAGIRPSPASDSGRTSVSVHWALGAGAPTFPQRDRFRLESAQRTIRDSLAIDQPWDGSQLGFSSSLEAALRWRFLRPVVAAQWTFWDARAVLRDPRSGELLERTWRVDQLVGQAGFDALVPRGLLTITNARDPYVGWRTSYGLGRLEGLGRAWARGAGWQAHLGADVWSVGPFELGGRFGWSSLAMESDASFAKVLYEGQGSDDVTWNGSGIWLELVLRLDSRPRTRTDQKNEAPSPRPDR